MYFNIETGVAQNLSENLSIGRILSEKKHRGTGSTSKKTEVL